MKKVVTCLLALVIFVGAFGVGNAAASIDEIPPVMKTMSLPIDHINLLK